MNQKYKPKEAGKKERSCTTKAEALGSLGKNLVTNDNGVAVQIHKFIKEVQIIYVQNSKRSWQQKGKYHVAVTNIR